MTKFLRTNCIAEIGDSRANGHGPARDTLVVMPKLGQILLQDKPSGWQEEEWRIKSTLGLANV